MTLTLVEEKKNPFKVRKTFALSLQFAIQSFSQFTLKAHINIQETTGLSIIIHHWVFISIQLPSRLRNVQRKHLQPQRKLMKGEEKRANAALVTAKVEGEEDGGGNRGQTLAPHQC